MSPRGHRRNGVVRSYTATGGRAAPSRTSLDEATLLIADPKLPLAGLQAQAYRVMDLCLPGVLSVSEVAHHLRLPGAVTKVVVSGLVDSGHLVARAPFTPTADQHDEDFLRRVLHGLQQL
ncbi:DUF742 domain-containing protein [Planomonospora sp. ID82291]|uniref:DUF742 domain-containing protein n=1 Tax=Planomonospora sp. ID82291 TaxID=2738136 RepID=UPI0018C396FF|nr:DUF742 domain-containing protein [Planomonospora sp. ID82291]MBG0817561.1 DUF742 domain-containing protein [Planomonospora sp. ID82291]